MSMRLMSAEDLVLVTGKRHTSKQVEWFLREFRFEPPRSARNRIVLTWETFQALQARRAGLTSAAQPLDVQPTVYPLRKLTT